MRGLIVCTLLLAALTPCFAETAAEPDRQALVGELVTVIAQELDREMLARLLAASVEHLVATAAAERSASEQIADPEARRALERELTSRTTALFREYVRSEAFADSVLKPWVEQSFTTDELVALAAFIRTPAGRKFVSRLPRIQGDATARAAGNLEPEVMSTLFGVRAEEIFRTSRIKRTAADMRTIGTALNAFRTDHGRYPPVREVAALTPHLAPVYIKNLPEKDAWGRPFTYFVSDDGLQYRIVSGGADGVIESRHRRITPPPARAETDPAAGDATADLVYQDGIFITLPQAIMASVPTPPVPMGQAARRPPPGGYERVGGEVRPPRIVHRAEPRYPAEARAARISGIVIIEALIDTAGRVVDARVLRPLPLGLDQAALDAVRQWRFEPATKHGVPVPVVFNLTINFRLKEGVE